MTGESPVNPVNDGERCDSGVRNDNSLKGITFGPRAAAKCHCLDLKTLGTAEIWILNIIIASWIKKIGCYHRESNANPSPLRPPFYYVS